MKRLLFISIITSSLFAQTGIITSKGFQGGGFWAKINRPFTENTDVSYDFKLEYYSGIGLELFVGKLQSEGIDPWNYVGLSYHFKSQKINLQFQYIKNRYNDYDFTDDGIYFEENSITFYKTSVLNPFLKFTNINKHDYGFDNDKEYFVSIGGLGRITRFMTFSCSLKLPYDKLFDINNGTIEASVGFIGLEELYDKYMR